MPDKRLYTLVLNTDAQTGVRSTGSRNVRAPGLIGSGTPAAESAGLNPGERTLDVTFRGARSDIISQEVADLFDAPDYEAVPYFGMSEQTEQDGYYVLSDVTTEPVEARAEGVAHTLSGTAERKGTRNSHFRRVNTTPASVDNDFGNDQYTHIGIPATAQKVRWWDPVGQSTERPTPTATRASEYGDVDIYDVDASSLSGQGDSGPPLVFDLPYDQEGRVDVGLWDERGVAKADADGNVQWQKVFTHDHDWRGEAVLDNGLIRFRLDDEAETLDAEEWDDASGAWTSHFLGASGWVPEDVDVFRVEPSEVAVQVDWRNTGDGSHFALNCSLKRGWDEMLFAVPPSQSGTTPSGLQSLLDPIASTTLTDPDESTTLVKREEVRR